MPSADEVRATLHVYLAAAAGAGKTIAMLDEGRRLRAEGGDVVIAVVEDHDRSLTQARAEGLEIVPRRTSEYRGAPFTEMDLDGVLRRNPGVALVDELAHTNVPGSDTVSSSPRHGSVNASRTGWSAARTRPS
jgi:two-component system, OmpR family, sensor histidine kinase KdpD